jgi:hypothetical protein
MKGVTWNQYYQQQNIILKIKIKKKEKKYEKVKEN